MGHYYEPRDCGCYVVDGVHWSSKEAYERMKSNQAKIDAYPGKALVAPLKPRTLAVTSGEGGSWIPFLTGIARTGKYAVVPPEVHSILFDDGSVWDAVNGWRN